MIIIKTKTGNIFVNDKEVVDVTHNRELHTAEINNGKTTRTLCYLQPIEHVESVAYINEQTGKDWKDEGSELAYLRKEKDSLKFELQCRAEISKRAKEHLRQLGHECVQWVQYYHENMPKDLCEQMRKRGEEEKAYVNDHEDRMYRSDWMQNHQKPEQIEADEVARLNTTIEAQAAEIHELKGQIKRMVANERMRTITQPSPEEHPEEKKPWLHRLMAWFE